MHLVVISHACVTDINQQVYAEIEKMGHQVDLIVPSNFVAPGLADKPISVKRWPQFSGRIMEVPIYFNKSIPLHFYKKRLKHFFENCKPDAVYVAEEPYSLSCFQVLRSALPYTKAIGFYSAQNIKKNYPFLFRKMEKYVYKHSSLAVSISEDVTKVLREKGYQNKIYEVPLGVDEEYFIVSPDLRVKARKEVDIPSHAFVIGFAGRIVKEKGIDLLIKAFSSVYKRKNDMYLLIVGRGPLLELMKQLAIELGVRERVKFINDAIHTEMPKWFNCMDVHVLPSITISNWREQFGRVLIEAAACGVPSIGSSSGEIPYVMDKLGMKSIFKEGEISQLATEIIKASEYKNDANTIRTFTIEKYGNKGVAAQLINAFEAII
ncbi:glycosyltransferase [Bacillus circulans]|uniref:glycosyltransferase n=1 Tax=Niallia circulans TaxID=1397 RepID=UPI0002FA2B49|nr:glycosyltransferase [Niallia circulans]NRG28431.1 glycosyltransferase [Niallia circulans]